MAADPSEKRRLPPALDIRNLQAFLAVAEELHFGNAACRLGIAQPPLSQLIRKIEQALGYALFVRDTRKVELTPPGEALVVLARDLLARLDGGLKHVAAVARGDAGRLEVGFTPTVALDVLPRIIRGFRATFPAVEAHLFEMLPDPLHEALGTRSIDVAIMREPSEHWGNRIIALCQEPFVAVLPAQHRLADPGTRFRLGELRDEPFVLFPHNRGSKNMAKMLALCAEASFLPRIVQEVPGWQTAVSMVGAGIGVSIQPASVMRLQMQGVVYRPVPSDIQSIIALVTRPDEDRPMIANFIEACRNLMAARSEHDQ